MREGGFGGVETDGAVGEGGGGETDFCDGLVGGEGYGGQGCLGDGLRVAGAYFADEVLVVKVGDGDGYAVEELVWAEGGAFVGLVEVGVGDFSGGGGGDEGDGGVVNEQGGWGVGGGGGVADVAA